MSVWLWLVLVLLALIALWLFLIAPARKRPDASALTGRLYAHRGLHDGNVSVPENSMRGFRLAVENGYGIELDTQLTRDGVLIVHHDPSTLRVCGVDKTIAETDYADLPALPDGESIPLFEDVLHRVAGRVPLIVEVKYHGDPIANARRTLDALEKYAGPFCVESFHPLIVRYVRKRAPGIVRGQLAGGGPYKPNPEESRIQHFAMRNLLVNCVGRPHFVAYSAAVDQNAAMWMMKHAFRPLLAAWTLRDQKALDRARREGYHLPIFERFIPNR